MIETKTTTICNLCEIREDEKTQLFYKYKQTMDEKVLDAEEIEEEDIHICQTCYNCLKKHFQSLNIY